MKSVFVAMFLLLMVGCSSSDSGGGSEPVGSTPPPEETAPPEGTTPEIHAMTAGDSYVGALGIVDCNTSGVKTVVGSVVDLVPGTEHTLGNTTFTCTL